MRPLKLEIEGFTSFNDPTYLDMTDLDLFAITGPTGAGKSSLIDAMCYALYGEIPRVGTEVGSCIRFNHDRMRVTLEFAAIGKHGESGVYHSIELFGKGRLGGTEDRFVNETADVDVM